MVLSSEEMRLNFYDTMSECYPNSSGDEAHLLCISNEIACASSVITHWRNEFVVDEEMRLHFCMYAPSVLSQNSPIHSQLMKRKGSISVYF